MCGESVPRKAHACPECGADYNSGWRDEADSIDALGSLETEFDYDEFAEREFGEPSRKRTGGVKPIWWITALLLLLAFVLYFVARLR